MKTLAVYKRVSTDSQDTAMQDHAISTWLATRPPCKIVEYTDLGISGKTLTRPRYQEMLADIEAGKIDGVIVYRLDRLSRDSLSALRQLLDWMHRGIEFFAVDQPALQLGNDNPMRLTILAVFTDLAQIERETIVSRVKAGLRAAKARGVKLGAPRKLSEKQRHEIRSKRSNGDNTRKLAREYGVSPATISRC